MPEIEKIQRQTEDGIREVSIYRKNAGTGRFSVDEYVDMLCEFLEKEHTVLEVVHYEYLDNWLYEKSRTVYDPRDIHEMKETDGPFRKAEAFFADDRKKYRFTYDRDRDDRLELESW